jgi:hypothetical protein
MIGRTSKYLARYSVMAGMLGFAAYGHAGTATVSPALAACSKALVQSIAGTEPLPAYSVKPPSTFVASYLDPYSFTVLAHSKSSKALLAKASCRATPAGEIVSFKAIPLKS